MKIQQIGLIKISSKKYQLLLTATKYNDIINLINNINNNTIS